MFIKMIGIVILTMPFSLAQVSPTLIQERLHSLELLQSQLNVFADCGVFTGEWHTLMVAFPSNDWEPIYYIDFGTYYVADIRENRITPLWCATYPDDLSKGENVLVNNTFAKFQIADSPLQQFGQLPVYVGEMDIYITVASTFSLKKIDAKGRVICEEFLQLDWPGQLPLEQLPSCFMYEK
jgi:hypothetical protein